MCRCSVCEGRVLQCVAVCCGVVAVLLHCVSQGKRHVLFAVCVVSHI